MDYLLNLKQILIIAICFDLYVFYCKDLFIMYTDIKYASKYNIAPNKFFPTESFFVRIRNIIVIKIRKVEIASSYSQLVKN